MKVFYKKVNAGFKVMCLIINIIFLIPGSIFAQVEKKYVRQGNHEYENNKFSDSEISYRRAIDKNKIYPDAVFNIGDALYKQKKFEEAGKQFAENTNMNEQKGKKADALYNLGNSLLMNNKVKESIEAYKNSLRINPGNMEAKYNLAYAQDLLKQQQQQQQQQNQDNKDKNKNQEQNKNQDDQKQQDNQEKQQQQPKDQKISKEDAERLLNAIANDEKDVQEKVKLAKAAKSKVRTLKNW